MLQLCNLLLLFLDDACVLLELLTELKDISVLFQHRLLSLLEFLAYLLHSEFQLSVLLLQLQVFSLVPLYIPRACSQRCLLGHQLLLLQLQVSCCGSHLLFQSL